MGEEMDVEALQAQIDLSNSIAYDLVSSWMKPTTSPSTESDSHARSREFEEYAKRPPRLGLGSTVSKSKIATSHEAARLKGKLTGQKRPVNGDDFTNVTDKNKTTTDDGDEEDSRSAAISTKKIQVNGVQSLGRGVHKKEKDKRNVVRSMISPSVCNSSTVVEEGDETSTKRQTHQDSSAFIAASVSRPNPFVLPNVPPDLADPSVNFLDSHLTTRPIASADGPSPSKKRKKHQKKNKHKGKEVDSTIAEDEEWTGFSIHIPEVTTSVRETDKESSGSLQSYEAGLLPSTPAPGNIPGKSLSPPTSIINPTSPARHLSTSLPLTSRPAPLLNIYGPPDVETEAVRDEARPESESPKERKSRRRRGRQKRRIHGDAVT